MYSSTVRLFHDAIEIHDRIVVFLMKASCSGFCCAMIVAPMERGKDHYHQSNRLCVTSYIMKPANNSSEHPVVRCNNHQSTLGSLGLTAISSRYVPTSRMHAQL